jgi:hypothetical protein
MKLHEACELPKENWQMKWVSRTIPIGRQLTTNQGSEGGMAKGY